MGGHLAFNNPTIIVLEVGPSLYRNNYQKMRQVNRKNSNDNRESVFLCIMPAKFMTLTGSYFCDILWYCQPAMLVAFYPAVDNTLDRSSLL